MAVVSDPNFLSSEKLARGTTREHGYEDSSQEQTYLNLAQSKRESEKLMQTAGEQVKEGYSKYWYGKTWWQINR